MTDLSKKVVYQDLSKIISGFRRRRNRRFKGIIRRLDYLKDLGVDILWLTPVFPSPQRDNGMTWQITAALTLCSGTMEDMEELILEGKKGGIGLMLDMVFNHTSTSHSYLQKALSGEKEYQDYYIREEGTPDKAPTNWERV